MADQLDPEQIARASEALEQLINGFSKSKTVEEKRQDAQERFGKALGKSAADLGSSLYKGEKGAAVFGTAVDSATGSLSMLILALGPFSIAAKVAAIAVAGFGKAVSLAAKQSDALYKSYQDLSRAGAATAGGMTEVFENMQKFGYGLEELEQMTALVKANSKELGLFVGTVGQGTRLLADTAESIQRSGIQREFLNMGMKVDDINKSIAGYIVQQGRLGRLQGQTQAEINAGARAYIREMEILTRLTGQQREEMEQQRESANAIDQFYATVEELGPAGDNLYSVFNQLMAVNPSMAKGFAESVSGFMGFSEDQNQLYMATSGALMQNMEALKTGALKPEQFLNSLGVAINQNKEALSSFAKTGATEFGQFYSNMKLGGKDFVKSTQDAAASLKPLDDVTDTATGMRQDQMRARDSLQSFVRLGVKPATEALAILAKGGAGAAGMLPGGGSKAPMGGGGGGAGGAGGAGGGGGGKAPVGGGAGGIGGNYYNRMLYGGGEDGGAAGAAGAGLTGKSLSGVSSDLAQALQMAATEYKQVTGKTVEVTSAVRDSAKQAELYQAYVSGKSRFPAAPPGTSKHERGLAVDISQAVADDMDRMGLLKKYGLSRPVANDPVHLEVSAANGAILSGPMSGYKPNLTMHGTEAIVPLNSPAAQSAFGGSDQSSLMSAQLDKLDELVRVMQNQVSVSTKILQAAN